jgi:hypothetical protein
MLRLTFYAQASQAARVIGRVDPEGLVLLFYI